MSLYMEAWCLGSGTRGAGPGVTKGRGAAGLTLRGCHIRKQLGQHRMTCVLEPFQSCLARRGPGWKGSCSFASARAVRACPYFCLHLPRCDLVCRRLGERPLASASASHKDAVSQAMSHHYRAAPTWIKTLLLYSRHRMCGATLGAWGLGIGFGSRRGWLPQVLSGGASADRLREMRNKRPRRTSATRIDECG